ncbi:ENTH-domain-containing protein [Epithele typhae]|uniref:ENTH-domain-containing protein n=1 Tax=Epithele typhae TaxID=378194 RepID=UPI00200871B4|nr:ENTH-domain-containing protein [Epithele typhae]KAH9946378.1 ENTH-domain-containing protein [Epithele typhae]
MSGMQHLGKGIIRTAKNYTKGYSDVQAKVREATSNDPWGPSGTQMNELAQLSYNQDHFVEIMEMLDKRLNDKGKNWRHVFKSLTVLDYLLHAGSENVVVYFKDNIYIIKTLKEFQFIDEEGKDQGANDESRLRHERRDRAMMRDRMVRNRGEGDGDDEEEQTRERMTAEERDLQQAIKLSEEEEAKRHKAAAEPEQLLPLVDTSLQAPQFMQPQFTSVQPQFTAFNPYQQQAQQEAMQAEYLRQQQEWQMQQMQQQQLLAQQQQQDEWMRQQQMLQMQQQQQQQQQQAFLMPQQPLAAQPTGFGSNNPFAPAMSLSTSSLPTGPQQTASPVSSTSPPPPSQSAPPAARQNTMPAVRARTDDGEHAKLAGLLANREDGVDTFGNWGNLRYGQQVSRVGTQPTGAPQGTFNPFAQQQQQQQQSNEQPFFSI